MNLIKLVTEDEIILDGMLCENNNNSDKVVIFVHEMAGDFYSSSFLGELLEKSLLNDYHVLTFNNRGHGFSNRMISTNKEKENKKIRIGANHEKISESFYDINAAIKYCVDRGYREIVLIGHSLGCTKIVVSFDKLIYKDYIKNIILISPVECSLLKQSSIEEIEIGRREALMQIEKGLGNYTLPGTLNTRKPLSGEAYLEYTTSNPDIHVFPYSSNAKFIKYSKIDIPILSIIGEKDSSYKGTSISKVNDILLSENNNASTIIYNDDHLITENKSNMFFDIFNWIKENKKIKK